MSLSASAPGAHDAIHPLAHQIDEPLALAEVHGQRGMLRQKRREFGQQHRAGEIAGHVDAHQSGHRAARPAIGVLEVGEDGDAATIIGIALDGRLDMARRALQQPRPQPLLERLDRGGRDRPRDAAVRRGRAEAAAIDDADEEAEGGEAIHAIIPSCKTMLAESAI